MKIRAPSQPLFSRDRAHAERRRLARFIASPLPDRVPSRVGGEAASAIMSWLAGAGPLLWFSSQVAKVRSCSSPGSLPPPTPKPLGPVVRPLASSLPAAAPDGSCWRWSGSMVWHFRCSLACARSGGAFAGVASVCDGAAPRPGAKSATNPVLAIDSPDKEGQQAHRCAKPALERDDSRMCSRDPVEARHRDPRARGALEVAVR